ncbi:hypothetical protein [Gimesia maris]|uniref:Four-helix bundle copper-binding protein n=1 Tax=Gimesia maris TaxID=122 RepID=A0ABX5YRR0_9PLAN|nr:hypothetical protein [Gimesia maris]QEG18260.1 hypothetical protein GmarT_41460 [Gimesia maris]QGQ28747.1 hypothetical protein F1729_08880 [Gimesia maris]|tara:strand:- start:1300 stop:1599 length:300 start_codon:yes stop_codon:yes gene_type:complete
MLPDAEGADANAITKGKCTCFAKSFFDNKSKCQQASTLMWEASRVSGNYVETDEVDAYNDELDRVAGEFSRIACCMECCNDLPAELGAPSTNSPTGCCP